MKLFYVKLYTETLRTTMTPSNRFCGANFVYYCFVCKEVLGSIESYRDSYVGMIVPWPKQVANLLPGFNNWVPREHGDEAIDTVKAIGDIEDASDHGGSWTLPW